MDIKTLDDRIREKARERFKKETLARIAEVRALIKNVSAVKGVQYEGKDVTGDKLLEVMSEHIATTQSFRMEEEALIEFIEQVERNGEP